MDKSPATIGKYRIEKILGRGGMGTVYEALDPVINRKLAIKTMIPGLADTPDLRARFMREAQAAGGLRHRNIVTVYDLGEDKGQPFIAMEFIEGTDLEKTIQKTDPHPLEWKLDVIRQLCEGLAYAHRAGIVHRDIKPANVRVTPEGEVKIMDFGIAHLQSSTMTKSGLVLGTVHYMAPEQVGGAKVDHRADIFSIGAIAYELLAGKKPFDGESLTAVMFKVMHERPDAGSLPRTEYSPGLETIVMKALARNIEERYQSLDEMSADLVKLVREVGHREHQQRSDPAQALLQGAREQRAAGRIGQALHLTREAVRLVPGHTQAVALLAELEHDDRQQRAAQAVEQGRRALQSGDPDKALQLAQQALDHDPEATAAKALADDARQGRLDVAKREVEGLRSELHRARTEGQLQKALSLVQRMLQLDPADKGAQREASDLESTIRDREVEQLCGMALGYVADGDAELALKIAARIEKLAPDNPRYLQLRSYLDEESSRKAADALTATAQDHLALGNLNEALAAAEEALKVAPGHALAGEIRESAATVLASQERRARKTGVPPPPPLVAPAPDHLLASQARGNSAGAAPAARLPAVTEAPRSTPPAAPSVDETVRLPPVRPAAAAVARSKAAPAAVPPAKPSPVAPPASAVPPAAPAPRAAPTPDPLEPLPEGNPTHAEAAELLERARLLLRDRQPQKALPLLEQAAILDGHVGLKRVLDQTRAEARRAEIEALNNAALDHFLKNNYGKAKKAVEKVLALDAGNKKAKDLLKILGPLG